LASDQAVAGSNPAAPILLNHNSDSHDSAGFGLNPPPNHGLDSIPSRVGSLCRLPFDRISNGWWLNSTRYFQSHEARTIATGSASPFESLIKERSYYQKYLGRDELRLSKVYPLHVELAEPSPQEVHRRGRDSACWV
jgi:hypothetical protein